MLVPIAWRRSAGALPPNSPRGWIARLALVITLSAVAPAAAATATRASVESDPYFAAWATALETTSPSDPATCATSEAAAAEVLARHARRMALLESLAARGIEPGPPPPGVAPWPWGLDASPRSTSAVVDSAGTSILVDGGFITYINRLGNFEVDPVLAARAFYAAHDDEYDFLVVFTNFFSQLGGGSFLAFHQAVANDVTGLGYTHLRSQELFNDATFYTRKPAAGRLQSFLHMNNINDFPADPQAVYAQRYSGVTVLGHELGHRWLARVRFEFPGLGPSAILLGRQNVHWSFFFNSGASALEGNAWAGDASGFGTLDRPFVYGPLDLYLMGMMAPAEVPDGALWYIDEPIDLQPPYDEHGFDWTRFSSPAPGVACGGTRVDFTVDDIAITNGYRIPAYPDSRRDFRAAFALVVRDPATVTPAQLAKLAALRDAFVPWFHAQTLERGTIDTALHSIPARMVFVNRSHGNVENPALPIPIGTRVTLEPWSLPTRIEDVRVTLAWAVDGGPSTETPMTGDGLGAFATTIPPQVQGATVRYWLRATSNFPDHESRAPAAAPDSVFVFQVVPDAGGPSVQHVSTSRWSRLAEPPLLRALVRDAHGVDAVWVESRLGTGAWAVQPMQAAGTTDVYETRLQLPGRIGDTVEYRILARDIAATPHTTIAPATGVYRTSLERAQTEDAEVAEWAWPHRSLAYARPDQWHREIVNPIGGLYSWKVGPTNNTVPGVIAPRQNAVLESPAVQVFPGGSFSFKHRYAFLPEEFDPRHHAIDGGLIEWQDVQRDGPQDKWYLLDPDAGYTHYVSEESDIPMQGYPIFSGVVPFARQEVCTFPPWVVNRTIRVRFHVFTSSPQVFREALDGWILDDFVLDPGPPPTAVSLEALAAERDASGVRLSWRAADLVTGDAFHIERAAAAARTEAPEYELLGTVAATLGQHDYGFEDADPPAAERLLYRVALWTGGVESASQVVQVDAAPRFALHANVPNPFNPTTRLGFDLPRRGQARLAIYDVRGRLVRVLVDATLVAGRHTATWDGRDAASRPAASGVYLARLVSAGQTAVRRMLLVR